MIFIPGNVPSSKNSRQILRRSDGKPFTSHSKLVSKYIKNTAIFYNSYRKQFIQDIKKLDPPYVVGFQFIRDTKRKFDYINAAQIVQDLMVKYEWLEDDNCTVLLPVFLPYIVDKPNCGVKIIVNPNHYNYESNT